MRSISVVRKLGQGEVPREWDGLRQRHFIRYLELSAAKTVEEARAKGVNRRRAKVGIFQDSLLR
jgi:hypothetical protein